MTNTDDAIDKWDPKRVVVWVTRLISYIVYFYVLLVEIILLLGFILLLFGANPSSGFVSWAYRNLDRVMEPFRGIFSPIEIGETGNDVPAVFETSVLFAMVIYGIIALILHAIIQWLTHRMNLIDADQRAEAQRQEYERASAELEARRAAAGLPPTNPAPVAPVTAPVTPAPVTPAPTAPVTPAPDPAPAPTTSAPTTSTTPPPPPPPPS